MGAIKTKLKHKVIMTRKINVESSHKSDQSGKTFKKLPLEAFEGSAFSHPLLYWVQSDLNVKSYVDIFCFHSCKSAMCQRPNAAYLTESLLSPAQRQHHLSDQTQLSHHTDLHAACSQSKAEPRHTEAEQGSAKTDKSLSFTSSESDASEVSERAHFKIDDVDKDSTAENK